MRRPPLSLALAFASLALTACGDDGGGGETEATQSGGSETGSSAGTDSSSSDASSAGSISASGSSGETSGETSTTDPSGTQSGPGTSDTSSATDSSGSTGSPGEMGLTASGSYDGVDFSLDCTLADDDASGNAACEANRWFATCRPDPTGVGTIETFQLWFVLPAADGAAGEKDYLDTQSGITIGDAFAQEQPLSPLSPNAVSNTITVTADADPMAAVSGTFDASWSDQGGVAGDVSGTFSFLCG